MVVSELARTQGGTFLARFEFTPQKETPVLGWFKEVNMKPPKKAEVKRQEASGAPRTTSCTRTQMKALDL